MKRPFPFYPPLVALFPVLSLFSSNLAYVPLSDMVRPISIVLAVTVVAWAALSLVLWSIERGAVATAALAICSFGFTAITRAVPAISLPVWAVGTVALMGLAAWKLRATKLLNVLGTFFVVMALGQIAIVIMAAAKLDPRQNAVAQTKGKGLGRPDIFYIILDGYGRSDALKRAIGFSNDDFIGGLAKRGFYVAKGAHSNYCQTELSLPSSLNMDFIPRLLPNVRPMEEERQPLRKLIDDNAVSRTARAAGYRVEAITTGFPPVELRGADLHIEASSGPTMIETAILQMLPYIPSGLTGESMFDRRRETLNGALDRLAEAGKRTSQPRLILVHILAPHPPFVFGSNGEKPPNLHSFGYWDGSDFMENGYTPAEYREGYTGQATYLDKRVLAALDRILADSAGHPPIVIIQGDHGSKVGLDQNDLAKTDLHECFPILNAYLVPSAIRKDLYPTITPVNSFRLLFRDLFGSDLPPLPDRSWYSPFGHPYDFTEVTDRIEPIPRPGA